jgi:hypothetical protein
MSMLCPPISGETCKYARAPNAQNDLERLSINIVLSAVSLLVVALSNSGDVEGVLNYSIFMCLYFHFVC